MLELECMDQISSYTGKELSIKDIGNSTVIVAEKLWIYYIHAGSLYRSGFSYKKRGSKILCGEFLETKEIESIPGYKKDFEVLTISEETQKKMICSLDDLVCAIKENGGIELISFSDSKNKKTNNIVLRTEAGLWEVKRKSMARTVFRSEMAAVVFASGFGIDLADRVDEIPEMIQKAVYREYGRRENLVALQVSWIDHTAVPIQKSGLSFESIQDNINVQTEEIAQENSLPGYFR